MYSDEGVSMAVNAYALPPRHQLVVVILGLVATVLVLLLPLRILAGLAYWVGSSVAIALIVFGTALQLRWDAKVKRLRRGWVRVAAPIVAMHLRRASPS